MGLSIGAQEQELATLEQGEGGAGDQKLQDKEPG